MSLSKHQLSVQKNAVSMQDSSPSMQVDQSETSVLARDGMQNGGTELVIYNSKKLQDDLQKMGLKIKQHEATIRLLKTQRNKLEDFILDLQVTLGKFHSSSAPEVDNEDHSNHQSEEETTEQILQHEESAAAVLFQMKMRHGTQASLLPVTKDVVGIVASLGKVEDENLSRLLSEYLGVDGMLTIVCKTFEGVKALETYDKAGLIIKSSGLHGLATSIGRAIDCWFLVICLENLSPFVGECVADDPQRRLDLWKPKLPNGESPTGFLGYAVNMIVYKTRADMLLALPLISDGAISLDGGMIRSSGVFSLGSRRDVAVRFPKSSGMSDKPDKYTETEKQIQEMKWKKETLQEDLKREQCLLNSAKDMFERKKQEFVKVLAESSTFASQHQMQAARERFTPRCL